MLLTQFNFWATSGTFSQIMTHKCKTLTHSIELYDEVLVARPVDAEHKLSLVALLVLGLPDQVVSVSNQQPLHLLPGQHPVEPVLVCHAGLALHYIHILHQAITA